MSYLFVRSLIRIYQSFGDIITGGNVTAVESLASSLKQGFGVLSVLTQRQ
ncbi:MAG: hypothetical protein V7K55_20505 [Nostoc sp.]